MSNLFLLMMKTLNYLFRHELSFFLDILFIVIGVVARPLLFEFQMCLELLLREDPLHLFVVSLCEIEQGLAIE